MANIFKFTVTNKVKDTVGLGIGNYAAGDTIYLNEKQLNIASIRNALKYGYLEPAGEDDSQVSENMMDYYNGSQLFNKNYLPVSTIELVNPIGTGGIINVQATDLCGDLSINKRVSVDKLLTRFSAASATATAPRLLTVAGDSSLVTPTLLTAYDDTAGTYTAATNVAIAAAVPIAWAADDMLIVGYTEKFSSIVCDMITPSNQANVATPYYWDGTQWVEFSTNTDYTIETAGRTLSRAAAGDKTRMVWWEMPDAWVTGGPSGSLATSTDYCVAIKFSGALTNLAGCSVYPTLDKPIADIKLGYDEWAPEAVILKLGAVYSDETDAIATIDAFNTTDYIWLGFAKPVSGFYVDVTNTNANASVLAVEYWNGLSFQNTPAVTDGTDNLGATLAKDGMVSLASVPTDWQKAVASNTDITGTNTPATISTEELYWLRVSVSVQLDAAVSALIDRGYPPLNYWVEYETIEQSYVDANDTIKVIVTEPENTIGGLTIQAVITDI